MQNDEARTIVFIDEQDAVTEAIVEDEDHELDEESDESVEVQPYKCMHNL